MILSCSNICKSFGENDILKQVSFHIEDHEKAAIVGINGAGKSTLLKVLIGKLNADDGVVTWAKGASIGYLAQHQDLEGAETIYDALLEVKKPVIQMEARIRSLELEMKSASGDELETKLSEYSRLNHEFEMADGYSYQSEITGVLKGLGFTEDEFSKPITALSGGQKTRVSLGKLLLTKPDILLLDEPTNHLDMESIAWLETYLRNYSGAVIIVAHDRYFLDRTVTRIIEIQDGKAEFYSGNYSFYAIEKERRYQERMKQYLKEQAKIAQLEKAAEQMHLWAFMGNDALHKRAFSMEKRIERMRTTAKPTKARKLEARFQSREFKGDEVLQIKGVSKAFGEKRLFEDVYLRCEGGERIALLGENGTGKTTLLNMLTGSERPDSGVIRLGPAVKAAYLPQVIHFEHPERSILDTMLYELDITPQSARNRLAAYQFTGEDVFKSVSVLSGGELSRLRLCMLMDESINLLILDEPTNHLDIDSREWLEQAVEAFDGTLLFVSHDRYFINRFATRVWELAGGVITDYPMGFAQYRQAKEEERAAAAAAVQVQSAAPKKNGSRGNRAQQAAKKQLTICETAIARLEADSARLEAEMAENACDAEKLNALYQEQQDVQKRLEQEMERWEELSLQAEEQEER